MNNRQRGVGKVRRVVCPAEEAMVTNHNDKVEINFFSDLQIYLNY